MNGKLEKKKKKWNYFAKRLFRSSFFFFLFTFHETKSNAHPNETKKKLKEKWNGNKIMSYAQQW